MYTSAFLLTKAPQIAEFQFEFWIWKVRVEKHFRVEREDAVWKHSNYVNAMRVYIYICVCVEMCMRRCVWMLPVGSHTQGRSRKIKGEFRGFCHTAVASLSPNSNTCNFFFPLSLCLESGVSLQVPLNEGLDLHTKPSQIMGWLCSYVLNLSILEHKFSYLVWKQVLKWVVLKSKDSVFLCLEGSLGQPCSRIVWN